MYAPVSTKPAFTRLLDFVACGRGNRQPSSWEYVGDGRGAYEVVETLVWVGEGGGSIDLEEGKSSAPEQQECHICSYRFCGRCMLHSVQLLVILGSALLVVSLFRSGSRVDDESSSNGPAVAGADNLRSVAGFECEHAADVRQPWPLEQLEWCCRHRGIGCKRVMAARATGAAPVAAPPEGTVADGNFGLAGLR